MAVNVIGQTISSNDEEIPVRSNSGNVLLSICDDLSFSMYVEESISEVVRVMETKKLLAVNGNHKFVILYNKY